MMKKILCFLALIVATSAHSAQLGDTSDTDTRVRYYDYHREDVYSLSGYYGFSTTVFFREDEKVETISLGDPRAWDVQVSGNRDYVFLKPILSPPRRTNLTVITDLRTYSFDLRAGEVLDDDLMPSDLSLKVRFRFTDPPILTPDPDAVAEARRLAEEERRRADEAQRRAEDRADARRAEEARLAEEERRRADEAQRRADEARRAEEERQQARRDAMAARLAAPSLIYDAMGEKTASTGSAAASPTPAPLGSRDFSTDLASASGDAYGARMSASRSDDQVFLDDQAARGPQGVPAQQIFDLSSKVIQGALISGTLETAIDSTLSGMIRAVVSQDVYAADGTRVLIPRGSRLIGAYRNAVQFGTSRVLIAWNRVITPSGISVELGSPGTDALGRAGLPGFADNHFVERFGAAFLISAIEGGSVYAVASVSDDREVQRDSAEQISDSFGTNFASVLEPYMSIPTTVHVDQGARIIVYVARDLDFSSVMEPVQ